MAVLIHKNNIRFQIRYRVQLGPIVHLRVQRSITSLQVFYTARHFQNVRSVTLPLSVGSLMFEHLPSIIHAYAPVCTGS